MKFQLKSLVAAAALAAAGVASAGVNPDVITATPGNSVVVFDPAGSGRAAELTLVSGGGALRFSNGGISDAGLLANGTRPTAIGGLVGALNTGKVNLTGIDEATILSGALTTDTNVTMLNNRKQRGLVSISANVINLSANGNTGDILTVGSKGGSRQDAPFIDGTLEGGQLSVYNLRFDLQNKVVIADLTARPMVGGFLDDNGVNVQGTLSDPVTFTDVSLWNIGFIQGPTVLPPEGLLAAAAGDFSVMQNAGYTLRKTTPTGIPNWGPLYEVGATNVLGDLTVTDEGLAIFAAGLGLVGVPGGDSNSIGYDALAGVNTKAGGWGSITSNIVFTAQEIPEPSTYALMGLGLVGISLVARRRAK